MLVELGCLVDGDDVVFLTLISQNIAIARAITKKYPAKKLGGQLVLLIIMIKVQAMPHNPAFKKVDAKFPRL